jgi:uncharacterized protein involved in outer membrane biogenesis
MRKAAFIIVGVLVVLILLAAVIPQFLDVNRYRGKIQSELEQQLNRTVTLGDMHVSLLPPSVKVNNAVIGEDKDFQTGRPFATAEQLNISLQLLPLLHKDIAVNSIELVRPQVELVRNAQGAWNFASLGNRTVKGATTPAKPKQNQQSFSLGELKLTDGTVGMTDLQKHQSRAVYDHIDLALKNFAPGKPFDLNLEAHLPGQGKQVAQLAGHGGPIDDASMLNTPFNGKVTLQEVSLDGVKKFLNSQSLAQTNGTISGDATVKNRNGTVSSAGNLKIANAIVQGHDIGYPISVDYDVSNDLNNDVLHIAHANVKLGSTPFAISGSLNSKPTPALMDVKINAGNVSIGELARLAAAFGYAFNPDMQVAGRISADVHAQGSTESPVLNGTLNASDLVISGKGLPQPVKVQAIQLALAPDVIRSGNFTATTGGTSVSGHFALSQYSSKSPIANATLQIPETELGDVLNIAHSFGAANDVTGNGRVALNVAANGPIKNTVAMTFNGNGALRNATIHTAALTQPVNIQNAGLTFTQNGVAIDNFAGSIASTHANGRLAVHNFDAPQIQLALNVDKIDALEWHKLVSPTPQKAQSNSPNLLSKATGGGPVNIGSLVYDQLVLSDVKSTVTLDHGIIKLAPVSAQVAGGLSTGGITIDTRPAQTQFTIAMNVQKVDANKLISSVSNVKNTLYGLLASNMQTQFHSVPAGKDIASTLNGHLALNLANGKLAGVDFLQQLGSVAGFQSLGRAVTGATELQKLTGDFDIQNGVAKTSNLRADLGTGTMAASGMLSLVDNSVNMKVTTVLNKAYSQQVGGSQVGGFMQTALANNQGELVLPVLVTGTLQSPKVAPDTQAIAQMKLQNLVPSLSNPGVLGSIFGKGGGTQQQGQQGNPLGQVLGALQGKQPKQPAPAADNNQQQQPQAQPQQKQGDAVSDAISGALGGLFGNKKKKPEQQQQPQNQQQQPPQNQQQQTQPPPQ